MFLAFSANMAAFPMGVEQKKAANNVSRVGSSPVMGEKASSANGNAASKINKTISQVSEAIMLVNHHIFNQLHGVI